MRSRPCCRVGARSGRLLADRPGGRCAGEVIGSTVGILARSLVLSGGVDPEIGVQARRLGGVKVLVGQSRASGVVRMRCWGCCRAAVWWWAMRADMTRRVSARLSRGTSAREWAEGARGGQAPLARYAGGRRCSGGRPAGQFRVDVPNAGRRSPSRVTLMLAFVAGVVADARVRPPRFSDPGRRPRTGADEEADHGPAAVARDRCDRLRMVRSEVLAGRFVGHGLRIWAPATSPSPRSSRHATSLCWWCDS